MTDKTEKVVQLSDILNVIAKQSLTKSKTVSIPKSSLITKINRYKIYSYFSSSQTNATDILPFIMILNETALKEPELFPIIFPANNQTFLFRILVQTFLKYLFIKDSEATKVKSQILSLLTKLLQYYDCKWETYEIIYDFLGNYFRKEKTLPKLTVSSFLEILQLLETLYCVSPNKTVQDNNHLPSSFFIHNGSGIMRRKMRHNALNIDNGINIIMWFYLKQPSFQKINEYSSLIEMELMDKNKIEVCLDKNYSYIKLITKGNEVKQPIIINNWYTIELIIHPGSLFGKPICTVIITPCNLDTSGEQIILKDELSKEALLKVKSINFFNNFYGLSTSIFMLNSSTKLEHKAIQLHKKIIKNKVRNNNADVLFKKFGAYNLQSANYYHEMLNNKLISFYTPFQCVLDRKRIIIHDCINEVKIEFFNYNDSFKRTPQLLSYLKDNIIFVNNFYYVYKKLNLDIQYIGGINVFLPLFNLMIEYDQELMTKKIFEEVMNIIIGVIKLSKNNLLYAIKRNIFYFLSRFLEVLPSHVYSDIVFINLFHLKEKFQYYCEDIVELYQEINVPDLITSFFDNIYLNIKIIKKFSEHSQKRLFESLIEIINENKQRQLTIQSSTENPRENEITNAPSILSIDQIKVLFNLTTISKFLYSLDKNKYKIFCCKKHATKGATNFLNPSFTDRIMYLSSVILKILELDINIYKEFFVLTNFLCLDLSPCLQLFCLDLLKVYIKKIKFRTDEDKSQFKSKCLSNQVSKIIIHLIKDSLWDIKTKAIEILIEFSNKIGYVLEDKEFAILKEILLKEAQYINVNEIKLRKRANSFSQRNHIHIKDEISNIHKRNKSIHHIQRYLKKKPKINLDKQIEQLIKLNFSDNYCEYITQYHSIKQQQTKENISHKSVEKIKEFLVVDDKIIKLYQILFLWTTTLTLSNSNISLANQIFSLIVSILHKSYSYTLLSMFLFDLQESLKQPLCSHFAQSKELFHFLLETAAHFLAFKNPKCNKETSLYIKHNKLKSIKLSSILQPLLDILSKIIHFNLKFNSKQLNIEYLLTWLTYHQLVSSDCKPLFTFVEVLIQEINDIYFGSLQSQQDMFNLNSKNSTSNYNLSIFINMIFEYITIQSSSVLLLTDPIGFLDIKNYCSPINIPCFLLTWVNINRNSSDTVKLLKSVKEFDLIHHNNHTLFTLLFYKFQGVWDIFKYCKEINKESTTIIKKKMKLVDQSIEQFVYCSKKTGYDVLLNQINFLFLPNNVMQKSKPHCYTFIPLIKIFFYFLLINIALNGEKESLAMWLEEYEKYLIFIIIANLNSINQLTPDQNKIFLSIIAFGLNFLLEQYKSAVQNKEIYNETVRTIIYLLYNIVSHKKFVTLFKKSALYVLFYELIVDERGKNILAHSKKFDIKIQKVSDYKLFYNESAFNFWNECLKDNKEIHNILLGFFGKEELLQNVSKRFTEIERIYPMYEININTSKINLIKAFQLKVKHLYNVKEYKGCFKLIDNITCKNAKMILDEYNKNKIKKHKMKVTYKSSIKRVIFSLFKFNGGWSDKKSFYSKTSQIPNKLINHYSLDMTMPLLTPILNKSYTLLHQTDSNYNHLANYDLESFFIEAQRKFKPTKTKDNNLPRTTLMSKYKKIDNGTFWDTIMNYKSHTSIRELINQLETNRESDSSMSDNYSNSFNVLSENMSMKSDYTNTSNNTVNVNEGYIKGKFMVCLVKQTIHIKGNLILSKSVFMFRSEDHSLCNLSLDNQYSELSLKCRGAFLRDSIYNYNNTKHIFISTKKIKYVFLRNYYFTSNAVEIFTTDNKGYYFHFGKAEQYQKFIDLIKNIFKPLTLENTNDNSSNIIGYYNPKLKKRTDVFTSYNTLLQNWSEKHSISTLNFISWLNILSGRSYKDLSKYPIFPWPITNYISDDTKLTDKHIRDFSKPMGILNINKKGELRKDYMFHMHRVNTILNQEMLLMKKKCPNQSINNKDDSNNLTIYNNCNNFSSSMILDSSILNDTVDTKLFSLKDYGEFHKLNKTFFHYPSTYSTYKYVLSFLIRVYPFKRIYSLSKYNKDQFNSINDSFIKSTSSRNDFKELTPEFFYMSEIFTSLPSSDIPNVQLPPWSNNVPYNVIVLFRKIIENDPNKNINEWLDLIFGKKQRNNNSKQDGNYFNLSSYQETIPIKEKDEILKPVFLQLGSRGIIPTKIINIHISPRVVSKYENISFKKGEEFIINELQHKILNKQTQLHPIYFIPPTLFTSNNTITMVLSDLSIHHFTLVDLGKSFLIEESSSFTLLSNSNEIDNHLYRYALYKNVFALYKKSSIIKGGFADGTVKHFYVNENKQLRIEKLSLQYDTSPVTAITISPNNDLMIFGTENGTLMVYEILTAKYIEQFNLKPIKVINDHYNAIITITFNNTLQIVATASYDECIFVYTVPTFKCIRSFKFPNYYAHILLISANPLPMFVFYCMEVNEFKLYTVNGSEIKIEKDDDVQRKYVTCVSLYTDYNYVDHLIVGTLDGYVIVRQLPNLKVEIIVDIFEDEDVCVKFVVPVLNGKGVLAYGNCDKIFRLVTKEEEMDNDNNNSNKGKNLKLYL